MGTMDADNGSDDGSADCQKKVRGLSIKFLDYLSAVVRDVTSRPQRDYRREQQALLWDERVTPSAYVLWGPKDSRAAWLTVKKVSRPQPSEVFEELSAYIDPNSIISDTSTPTLDDAALARHRADIDREVEKEFRKAQFDQRVPDQRLPD